MAKLRKGDQVIVIAGKDKGKQGTILAVKEDRVKVEGINIVKKTPKSQTNKLALKVVLSRKKHFYTFQMLQFIMQQPKRQIVFLTN